MHRPWTQSVNVKTCHKKSQNKIFKKKRETHNETKMKPHTQTQSFCGKKIIIFKKK